MTSVPPPAPKAHGWEILDRIGSGAMGDVWKARRADGALAALKVMKSVEKVGGTQAGSLFRREALACLNLDHPNLVRGLDAGVTQDGRAYIALEFVEGRTLAAEVRASGALDEKRVVAVGAALAKALAHAHRLGLVHRDVKPSNVMLSPGGGVKLLDLGLVVETAEGAGRHGLGTIGFAAPEIVAGEKAGPRADLFSLGATLAVAATGEVPTKERGFADRALAATAGGSPLSPEFRAVVERLLRSDAAARYGSAAELVLDFDALAAGERPLGAILGAGAARVVRRGPRVAAIGVLAALAAAGVWWIATRPAAAPHAAPLPPPPVAPPPAPLPAAPVRNAKLDAAKVFLDQFPEDLARGREVLAAVDEAALTPGELVELDELRASLASRADAAALAVWTDAGKRAADAEAAGDFAAAFEILAASRNQLRGSRYAEQAESGTQRLLLVAQKEARVLLEETKLALLSIEAGEAGAADTARAMRPRLDAALARPRFDGDRRADIAEASDRLAAAVGNAAVAETTTRAAAEQMTRLRCAVADHVARPSAERLHAALDAANFEAIPKALRESSRNVAAAWDHAEAAVGSSVAGLKGKPWCGPVGNGLFVGIVTDCPSADDVFLSPLWPIAGDDVDALTAVAGGTDEAAAWLLARGRFDDAIERSGPAGGVTALLAGARLPARPRADVPPLPGFTAALALREARKPADGTATGDRVADAWKAAISGRPRPSAPRNPAKAAGRDAFLKDDLAAAATALTDAMNADPWDAEVAALRGRVFLVGARNFPTAPALLAAFSEGRRAWELDPKMPAGPVLAAESGIELSEVAGRDLAERIRPIVAAACDAAAALGREDARMLAFAAEWRLQAGRTAEAVALLRRAVAKEPDSGRITLSLARAEHAAGHDDKAKAALRRARELLGGNLPASAADLARALGE